MQRHDVASTLIRRCLNVACPLRRSAQRAHDVYTSNERRCIDVHLTSYKRHVSAGKRLPVGELETWTSLPCAKLTLFTYVNVRGCVWTRGLDLIWVFAIRDIYSTKSSYCMDEHMEDTS